MGLVISVAIVSFNLTFVTSEVGRPHLVTIRPYLVGDVDINLGNTLEQCLYAEECVEDHILCPQTLV